MKCAPGSGLERRSHPGTRKTRTEQVAVRAVRFRKRGDPRGPSTPRPEDQKECREQIEEGWLAARRGDFVDGDEVFDRIDAELAAADMAKNDRSGRL